MNYYDIMENVDDLDAPEEIKVDCQTCKGAGGPCPSCGGRGYFIEREGVRVE